MSKSYNNCPLKKRPFYPIMQNDVKLDDNASDEAEPVDLSSNASKFTTTSPSLLCRTEFSVYQNEISSDDYQEIPISLVLRKSEEFTYSTPLNIPDGGGVVESYQNVADWDQHNGNDHAHLRYIFPYDEQYTQQISPTFTEPISPYTFRGNSISPPPPNVTEAIYNTNYQNRPFVNYNNNNLIKSEAESRRYYSNKLQKSSSMVSLFSSETNIINRESEEPEDLSVKINRKSSILTNSGANILNKKSFGADLKSTNNDHQYYRCDHCVKCYSTYAGLVKHKECHFLPVDLSSSSNGVSNKNRYHTNSVSNENNGTTEMTGITDSNDRHHKNLVKKMNIVDYSDKAKHYQCNECNKSYSTHSGLTKHQQFHCPANGNGPDKKSFSCKNCDKKYVSLGALKMHIRTHTLPCKCPICGKAFSRPWLLQGHIRTHTGEKPFTCQHCDRAFADRSNLRAHLQTHSNIKKYSCTNCLKSFSRMTLLVKHSQSGCSGESTRSSTTNSIENAVSSSDSIYRNSENSISNTDDRHFADANNDYRQYTEQSSTNFNSIYYKDHMLDRQVPKEYCLPTEDTGRNYQHTRYAILTRNT